MTTTAGQSTKNVLSAHERHQTIQAEAGQIGGLLRGRVRHPTVGLDRIEPVISLYMFGYPGAQGSHKYVGHRGGKPILKEQNEAMEPWRDSIRQVVAKVTGGISGWEAINEAVVVSVVFTMPPTAAATKRGDVYHTGTPDLDKLQRAVGDGLSPAKVVPADLGGVMGMSRATASKALMVDRRRCAVLHDDSRIVRWIGAKVYPSMTVDALKHPGVVIEVWRAADLDHHAAHAA